MIVLLYKYNKCYESNLKNIYFKYVILSVNILKPKKIPYIFMQLSFKDNRKIILVIEKILGVVSY